MGNINSITDTQNSYIVPTGITLTDNIEHFNQLYKYIFSKLDGFKAYSYREQNFYYEFDDPRKDERAIKLTRAGRPMCGEITIMNLLNFLLFNKKTKQIDFNYLPEITQRENKDLTDFYKQYNVLSEYNKKSALISKFFSFMIDIPFEIISGIDDLYSIRSFERDYGDYNIPCVYRYNTIENKGGKTFIKNGVELRVTYFNLLRVLSFILKLDGELELRKLEENRNDDTFVKNALKEIIKLFQNPDIETITKDYTILFDKDDPIYSYSNPIEIGIYGANLKLSAHSEFNLISNTRKNFRKIKKLFTGYKIILNKINYTKENPVDIYSSIFFAIFKENNIYSEINFKYIPENYIIKFLNVLHLDFDDLYIPGSIIIELINFKKTNTLKIIFDKFNFLKKFYSLYLNYLIVNGIEFDINEYLKKYFLKYTKLSSYLFSDIINYNNIQIVKNIIDAKKNRIDYSLESIKTQEMFDLLDSTIDPKINKIKLYHQKIVGSIFNNKSTKFDFIDSTIFRKILKKNIEFYKNYIFGWTNISKNFIEKISTLDSVRDIITPKILSTNISSYKMLKIIKLKLPYYKFESDDNLKMLISNNYKRLIGVGIYDRNKIRIEKIEEQLDTLNLLCAVAEINKNLFLEQILCEIIDFRTNKNKSTDNSPVIISKTHLLSEYINHKFYEKFSDIFNSLNIYSNEYVYLCQPIFKLLSYQMKDEILKVNFKKIKDKSEIKIIKNIIEEYPKLYEKNMTLYSINMYKIYGSTYLPKIRSITRGNIKSSTHQFIFTSYNINNINLKKLLVGYYGTDEFTDFLINDITSEKLSSDDMILTDILYRYYEIGHDSIITFIASDISKKNSKYTKEYICKNMIKLLNVVISRINFTTSPDIAKRVYLVILKLCNTIRIKNRFLIKCLKNIINVDKLIIPDTIHKIKRTIDQVIKTSLEVEEGIYIKDRTFKSLVDIFNNEDLKTIVKKLGMK
jgi:hypothetical protein